MQEKTHRTRLLLGVMASVSLAAAAVVLPVTAADAASTTIDGMAAMGDSITRAASADGTGVDNSANSWSTGTSIAVDSHRNRLSSLAGVDVDDYNVAKSGSTSSDLLRQAALVAASDADYVTLLTGANNICQQKTVASIPSATSFGTDVQNALTAVVAGRPGAKIMIASIPSLMGLYDLEKGNPQATIVWAAASICPVMLANPADVSAAAVSRRAAVEQAIVNYNTALAAVCDRFANCAFDDNAVYNMASTITDVNTRDYFHPSLDGQNKIAEVTWNSAVAQGLFGSLPTSPKIATVDNGDNSIQYTASWGRTTSSFDDGRSVNYATATPASYSLTFYGSQISVETRLTSSSGISEVKLDGQVVGTIDGYSPTTKYRAIAYTSDLLLYGSHTLTVTSSKSRNASSTGSNLILDALLVRH